MKGMSLKMTIPWLDADWHTWILQAADDDLILGHRDSEWLGLAPDLESDIAFSSIAQDEVGHALVFYSFLGKTINQSPDDFVYRRQSDLFRHAVLLERENGDFVYTIVRHVVYDVFDEIRLRHLLRVVPDVELCRAIEKILREEVYHQWHLQTVVRKLCRSATAKERIEEAMAQIWPDVESLFDSNLGAAAPGMRTEFHQSLDDMFRPLGVTLPEMVDTQSSGRTHHSESLDAILATIREVYNEDPSAVW